MRIFGVGTLFGVPLTDATGAAIANPTPQQFAVLQEVQGDISFDEKMLYGAKQFPAEIGRGKGKAAFKAKAAEINVPLYSALFFGVTPVLGIDSVVVDAVGAIPTTPFQVTPTVPGSGTWARDLGVKYSLTGISLTRVASAPATGQYSVAAGVYTFAAADTGLGVLVSFDYTASSTTQYKATVSSLLMGQAPSFLAEIVVPYGGQTLTMRFVRCIPNKLTLPLKNEDFSIPEFDFSAIADASDTLFTWAIK